MPIVQFAVLRSPSVSSVTVVVAGGVDGGVPGPLPVAALLTWPAVISAAVIKYIAVHITNPPGVVSVTVGPPQLNGTPPLILVSDTWNCPGPSATLPVFVIV